MNKNAIRCDKCGFFVAYKDIDSGAATRKLISPATEDSKEKWETICPKHNLEHDDPEENIEASLGREIFS